VDRSLPRFGFRTLSRQLGLRFYPGLGKKGCMGWAVLRATPARQRRKAHPGADRLSRVASAVGRALAVPSGNTAC